MQFNISFVNSFAKIVRQEVRAGERAATQSVRAETGELKQKWRGQITRAKLGRRLANTVRSIVYPQSTDSWDAAGLIWSNAPKIIGSFDQGVTIRSREGFFLAIPTEAAGKSIGGGRITPREWEQRRGVPLQFVFRRTGPSLLVAEGRLTSKGRAVESRSKTGRGRATIPIFILMPQVSLRKRLDLTRDAMAAQAGLPGRLAKSWDQLSRGSP